MSDIIKSFRPVRNVEILEGSIKIAPPAFCHSGLSYVVMIEPSALLHHASDVPGVKRLPIGENLQAYRLQKACDYSSVAPTEMPSASYDEYNGTFKLFDAPLVRHLLDQGAQRVPVLVRAC